MRGVRGARSLKGNSFAMVGSNLAAGLIQLIAVREYYRILGESLYAVYAFAGAIAAYVALSTPFFAASAQKLLTEAFHRGDRDAATECQRTLALVSLVAMAVGLFVFLALGLLYIIPGAGLGRPSLLSLFLAGGASYCGAIAVQSVTATLIARDHFKVVAAAGFVEKLVGASAAVGLAYRFRSPACILVGLTIGSAVSALLCLTAAARVGPRAEGPGYFRQRMRELLHLGARSNALTEKPGISTGIGQPGATGDLTFPVGSTAGRP